VSRFLDTLKSRLAEAQARHAEATKRFQVIHAEFSDMQKQFQAANAEFQSANQDMQGWAKAVEAETKRESAQSVTEAPQNSIPPSLTALPVVDTGDGQANIEQVNKTELVREVLRNHPTGLKPVEVWKLVQGQIPNRSYVYSVLGRLKDRELVSVKRGGKYFCRAMLKTPEEVKAESETSTVQ
jgi:hypothetical protein